MKIVQLVTARQRRGAEAFACELTEKLNEKGHEIFFVGLYNPHHSSELRAEGAENIDLDGHIAPILSFKLVSKLARFLKKANPDIIQANGADTLKYAVFARKKAGIKAPLIYRNISIASTWLKSSVHRMFYNYLFKNVDMVLSVSDQSRYDMAETYKINPAKIRTLRRGVFVPEEVDRNKQRQNITALTQSSADNPVLLHIGAFSEEKNHQGLLSIFEKVQKAIPEAHLICAGDGPFFNQMQLLVKRKKLRNTHMLGSRNDLPRWIGGADVLALTSLIEGIPGVVMEAGAFGIPSVAYDVGGVKEVIDDHENGFLVNLHDEDLAASRIIELFTNRELRSRLGTAARSKISRHYNIQNVADKFLEAYEAAKLQQNEMAMVS